MEDIQNIHKKTLESINTQNVEEFKYKLEECKQDIIQEIENALENKYKSIKND